MNWVRESWDGVRVRKMWLGANWDRVLNKSGISLCLVSAVARHLVSMCIVSSDGR